MSHNFENLLRWPVKIGCPLREMMADEAVNVAVHPLSQSWPTERRDPEAKEKHARLWLLKVSCLC